MRCPTTASRTWRRVDPGRLLVGRRRLVVGQDELHPFLAQRLHQVGDLATRVAKNKTT